MTRVAKKKGGASRNQYSSEYKSEALALAEKNSAHAVLATPRTPADGNDRSGSSCALQTIAQHRTKIEQWLVAMRGRGPARNLQRSV